MTPPPAERRARDRGALRSATFVGGAGLAFATSGPLAAWAAPAHPLVIACGRTALAALVLAAWDGRGLLATLRAIPARVHAGITVAGLLLAAHFGAFVWSLQRTSLPAAVSLVSLEPLAVVLWAFALHGIRPRRAELAGVLVATGGAVVVAQGAGVGAHRLAGDLLMVVAVALYGLYVNVARFFRDALPAGHYAALVYAVAALACLVGLLASPGATLAVPPHALVAIVALALLPTLVGHTAVQAAMRVASPSLVALVSPVETLGGLAIGALALGQAPRPVELAGAAIILAGATLAIALGPRSA